MQMVPYLNSSGQCRAAFEFYERCFGGRIEAMITHRETPATEHVPPDWQDSIMHARLVTSEQALMGSDTPPDRYQEPQGFHLSLHVESREDAERLFKALAENGTVQLPLEETFWAERFGMLVDRFGIPWMINYEGAAR